MKRARPIILALATSVPSWTGMQAIHELGHILAALATGGTVQRVILHPLTISRTDVAPNPSPLVVAWAGPLVGAVVPWILAGAAKLMNLPGRRYFDFFAGFCLIANGAYVGIGGFDGVGDAGEMLRHGSSRGTLLAFGIIAVVAGLWLWHRSSGEFGFGSNPRTISRREIWAATGGAAAVIIAAAVFGQR